MSREEPPKLWEPKELSESVARVNKRMRLALPYEEIWSDEFKVISLQASVIRLQKAAMMEALKKLQSIVNCPEEHQHIDVLMSIAKSAEEPLRAAIKDLTR